MYKHYSGQNLRGRSFKGQNLEGADFSRADIRGANFTGANLIGANFSQAKAGLQKRWVIILVVISWLLAGISGSFSAWTSYFLLHIFDSQLENQVAACISLIIITAFIAVIIRQGINAAFPFAVGFAVFFGVVGSYGEYFGIIGAGTIGRYAAFAGAFATTAVFSGAVAFAITVVLATSKTVVFTVTRTIAFVLGIIAAFNLSVITLDNGSTKAIFPAPTSIVEALPFIALAIGTVLFFLLSVYIGHQAMEGSEKYTLIRGIAVAFASLRGTSFKGANLTNTNFSSAILQNTNFRGADLERTCFQRAKKLDYVRPGSTYLDKLKVVKVLATGEGENLNLNHQDLRGVNFQGAYLQDASFQGADLSNANLQDADLSRAKLVQTQLDGTDFTGATLTGAYIEDWNITNNTNFTGVRCKYVYMRLPTKENPDPYRKPDNREEVFGNGEFGDFIKPIFDTLDLYHSQGVDPRAIAISFKQLAENHPEAELRIVGMEVKGEDKLLLRVKTAPDVDNSELSAEYFENYNHIQSLPERDIKLLLAEKDSRIQSLENFVNTALHTPKFYAQNYSNQGDTMSESFNNNNTGANIANFSNQVQDNASQQANQHIDNNNKNN